MDPIPPSRPTKFYSCTNPHTNPTQSTSVSSTPVLEAHLQPHSFGRCRADTLQAPTSFPASRPRWFEGICLTPKPPHVATYASLLRHNRMLLPRQSVHFKDITKRSFSKTHGDDAFKIPLANHLPCSIQPRPRNRRPCISIIPEPFRNGAPPEPFAL
jgi:hypothetical protein